MRRPRSLTEAGGHSPYRSGRHSLTLASPVRLASPFRPAEHTLLTAFFDRPGMRPSCPSRTLDRAEGMAAAREDVRLVHPEHEQRDQADVDGAHEHAVAGRHAVVGGLLQRARFALLPAMP